MANHPSFQTVGTPAHPLVVFDALGQSPPLDWHHSYVDRYLIEQDGFLFVTSSLFDQTTFQSVALK
jgi:hypothetical protein